MAVSVRVPNVGMGISEARIVRWISSVGDRVQAGEAIAEIETAKSTVEVEAPVSGTLSCIFFAEDAEIPVGTEIARIES